MENADFEFFASTIHHFGIVPCATFELDKANIEIKIVRIYRLSELSQTYETSRDGENKADLLIGSTIYSMKS